MFDRACSACRRALRPLMIPLPHPSGQSRWLNAAANRERLEAALALVAEQRAKFAP